eukprot:scaffold251379_cov38-Attheya_sp.AAC.2
MNQTTQQSIVYCRLGYCRTTKIGDSAMQISVSLLSWAAVSTDDRQSELDNDPTPTTQEPQHQEDIMTANPKKHNKMLKFLVSVRLTVGISTYLYDVRTSCPVTQLQ